MTLTQDLAALRERRQRERLHAVDFDHEIDAALTRVLTACERMEAEKAELQAKYNFMVASIAMHVEEKALLSECLPPDVLAMIRRRMWGE